MKVLLVTESYWPNADGGALFERRLVLGMAERGHEMTVWAPAPSYRSFDEIDGPYTIHRQKAATFWFNTKYKVSVMPFWDARRILRRDRPDVIHIHNAYWMGLSAMFWARRMNIPIVATNHFMPENAILNLKGVQWLYRPLEWTIWRFLVAFHDRADYVTSPTPTATALLETHGLTAPLEPITNGIDTAVFKPGQPTKAVIAKLGLATDRPIILYVGRLDGEKRLDVLLDAMPAVLERTSAQLVLAGYGRSSDELKAQSARLGITGDVVFTGFIDEADKPLLYNAAAVFTITSPAELQSIVTLEAMASGLPVVAVDVAALHELCHDGHNGYLFPHQDSAALADKLVAVLINSKLQRRFGQASLELIHASHSTEVMYNGYENAYEIAIKGTN